MSLNPSGLVQIEQLRGARGRNARTRLAVHRRDRTGVVARRVSRQPVLRLMEPRALAAVRKAMTEAL